MFRGVAADVALDVTGGAVSSIEWLGVMFQYVVRTLRVRSVGGEAIVCIGQEAGELWVVFLDVAHGGINFRADVLGFGEVEQVIEPRLCGQIQDALGVIRSGFIHAAAAMGGRVRMNAAQNSAVCEIFAQ